MPVERYLHEAPASGASASVDDLVVVLRELLAPTLIARSTLEEATSVAFPGLDGVLPGFGRQSPNDWGLGFELRDAVCLTDEPFGPWAIDAWPALSDGVLAEARG